MASRATTAFKSAEWLQFVNVIFFVIVLVLAGLSVAYGLTRTCPIVGTYCAFSDEGLYNIAFVPYGVILAVSGLLLSVVVNTFATYVKFRTTQTSA